MVQVLHFNMHRIYDLWGIFLSHVLEVLASAKAALRTAAMDAVGKAITGALDRPVPAREWRGVPCAFRQGIVTESPSMVCQQPVGVC
jgi:hypothetical protein